MGVKTVLALECKRARVSLALTEIEGFICEGDLRRSNGCKLVS